MLKLLLPAVACLLLAVACSNGNTVPTTPSTATVSGTWTGTARDSSGTTLGTGLGNGTGMMTWQLTQNGNQVTGTMSMNGLTMPMNPTITGTINGSTMTFQVSMPMGSMPMTGCTDSASGTMTMNTAINAMSGTYTGTNSCAGPYSNGQITLSRP